ncbi:MAG TPA: SDR family NAD(P)-dependent oxidoreductase [Acidimicrobiales bacterium]|nr:SDR family NAD(P)-dependent oxidoreductase [Acidimicrobiales bacterium]
MESFAGKLAVVTGGGTGMGRELVIQLAAAGASVATCDVNLDTLADTAKLAREASPSSDNKITTHTADVSDETQMLMFRDEVVAQHDTAFINLLFNNAGVGGGGSFVAGDRSSWDRTFGICWGGVYNGCVAFVPLLVASDDGYLVNTSSVNGFYASIGAGVPHTAYSAAKFAVKGFTEALIEDFRVNAPHVKVAVVMPGHIGTDIIKNSRLVLGDGMTNPAMMREQMTRRGIDASGMSDDDLANIGVMMEEGFKNSAPTSAAQAATIILEGVLAGKWRILVGEDAQRLDEAVRKNPDGAYDPEHTLFSLIGNQAE